MIKIKYCPEADTRTMKELPSKEALKYASLSHIGDVSTCIQFIINNLVKAINNHDIIIRISQGYLGIQIIRKKTIIESTLMFFGLI